ncbi:type II toxin-antitoxin system HicB family antitoxin [Xanthomonas sp. NCPPB 2632]|jgi:predicted RNase H-like HicB family nuclease|uniref:type II toxin-antitoxin system HicB family antitoxin n=1 Tax=Xanthomonas sp. NCPPB 2632 TaxID=3240912 RepID=UPI0035137318
MRYPIAIEPGSGTTAYGVIVPDLPGCFSAGDTLDEAVANAEEAILLFLEDAIEGGKMPPKASSLEALRSLVDFQGWTWALASVDLSKLSTKAVRVNITVPDRLLSAIDAYAERHGETRSGFLARAAMEAMEVA